MFNSRTRLRTKLVTAAFGVVLALCIVVVPRASTADAATCTPTSLVYSYWTSDGTLGNWCRNAAGSYPLNSKGFWLDPHRWSGYIYFANGTADHFCDNRSKGLGDKRVIRIVMSPTLIPACQH